MKHTILLIAMAVLSACTAKSANNDETKSPVNQDSIRSAIVAERISMVSALVKVGQEGKLCNDSESFWAYNKADSILKSIDTADFKRALAKTYVANSYLFYGISYVNTVMEQARRLSLGVDNYEIRFPSFNGYEDLLSADSLSWFDVSFMDAWSVNGMTFTTFVVGSDDYAQQRVEESKYDMAEINTKKDVLKDECLFTYATVLNSKCYFNNMIRYYYSEYASQHDGEVPQSVKQPVISIAIELESLPIKDLEEGKVSQDRMWQIQLQCAKLLNNLTNMWVETLFMRR